MRSKRKANRQGMPPGSRLASLDPTVHFVPGPPSYDAEGGTGSGRHPLTTQPPLVYDYLLFFN